MGRWLAAAGAAAALQACALLPGAAPPLPHAPGLPPQAELVQVPFYAQDTDQCGPASLAMALAAAGLPRTPQQLSAEVYLPGRSGSLQTDLLAATRRAGLVAIVVPPELDAVLAEVAAGHPVVVLQNLRWDFLPRWHYAVAVGYDLGRREIVLRSGDRERLVTGEADFDRSWAGAARWAMLALPPGELPASVGEDGYLAAVAVLERASPQAAGAAYRLALARWPQDLVARIGLGNLAYGAHDLAGAERQYRQASEDHPDAGDAWNNLAQVLHELGRDGEALPAAERAVGLGGPRMQEYRETLDAIRSQARDHP